MTPDHAGKGDAANRALAEQFAMQAYLLGGRLVDGEMVAADPCTTDALDLLLRMIGPCAIHLVDRGVAPGQAVMLFVVFNGHTVPMPARILRNQRQEQASIAYARACVTYLAWRLKANWDAQMRDAIAVAIMLPAAAIDLTASARDIAYQFVTPLPLTAERMLALRADAREERMLGPNVIDLAVARKQALARRRREQREAL